MSLEAVVPSAEVPSTESEPQTTSLPARIRSGRKLVAPAPFRFTSHAVEDETAYRQAELFYLQKQIQAQTPMMIVLADGEKIEGVIEWYDRRTLKVRGRNRTLVYKSAIKYMYKVGENGQML